MYENIGTIFLSTLLALAPASIVWAEDFVVVGKYVVPRGSVTTYIYGGESDSHLKLSGPFENHGPFIFNCPDTPFEWEKVIKTNKLIAEYLQEAESLDFSTFLATAGYGACSR